MIFPYICTELSLAEQLEHLSASVHLLLALYVHEDGRSHFVPMPLFVNTGIMVKNVFFYVAKAKLDHPMDLFFWSYLAWIGSRHFLESFALWWAMMPI
jgi:hypothetical protein